MLLFRAVLWPRPTKYLFSIQFLGAVPQGMSATMVLLTDLHGPVAYNSQLVDT